MGVIIPFNDSLINLAANLGTDRDKSSHNEYYAPVMTDEALANIYRATWLAKKIVNIPAFDAVRKWRNWQADKPQIQAIEAEEKRLNVKGKIKTALTKARLFGGAAIFLGTADKDLAIPLDPAKIGRAGLKYINVMTKRQLTAGENVTDPLSEFFGKPEFYTVAGSANVKVHRSRLVILHGDELPDEDICVVGNSRGWGESVLGSIIDAIKQSDATMANVASLIFEAKVNVIKIPNFMDSLDDPTYRSTLLTRYTLAATMKGNNGDLLLDAAEEFEQKQYSFGSMPDVMDRFLQAVSGAADIPATRLLGQSPSGLGATGESDTRNYYDRIQSSQELDLSPAMSVLDECLIRSATGARDDKIHYIWAPLWQPTATEKATIGMNIATTIKTLHDSLLFNDEALSMAAVTTLVENNVLPGLEAAIEEYGNELEPEEPEETPAIGAPTDPAEAAKE